MIRSFLLVSKRMLSSSDRTLAKAINTLSTAVHRPTLKVSIRSYYSCGKARVDTMVNSVPVVSDHVSDSIQVNDGLLVSGSECKEVQIPVPWGNLAAKVWGSENDNPILALHGWQDNCGTFDRLIPLLPPDFYVVCLDFCGHGHSSHYPAGMMYSFWDSLLHVRMVVAHFGWKRFSILGHSLGGIVGSMTASVFPDMVEKLVMIDIVKPLSLPAKYQPEKSASSVQLYLDVLGKLERAPPCYSYEGARERLVQANKGSIDEKAADVLMKRGTAKKDDGEYYFRRDLRLVVPSLTNQTLEQHAEYAKRITCPLLLIKANNGPMYEGKAIHDEFVQIYRDNAKPLHYVEVEGTHHVHLVNPENVAPLVENFLSTRANSE